MTGDSQWIAAPGFFHGLLGGQPASGDPVMTTTGPTVPVVIGEFAERQVVVSTGSLAWLADMESAFRTARERLSSMTFPPGRAA